MENAWDKPNKAIEDMLGKRTVFYSADEDMNEVAITGNVIFQEGQDEFWGEGEPYQSHIVTDPTWLDVAILADVMIHTTGDFHHIFLENIYATGENIGGVPVYRFSMGS